MTGMRLVKMDDRLIKRIHDLRAEGFTFKEIGRFIGVSSQLVQKTLKTSQQENKDKLSLKDLPRGIQSKSKV